MMETKLRLYLEWKGKLSERKEEGQGAVAWPAKNGETFQKKQDGGGVSEALKRKDQVMKERGTCRRRVRGGAPTAGSAREGDGGNSREEQKDIIIGDGEMRAEADRVANL
jgi:DNA excision repair protein ERCC-4